MIHGLAGAAMIVAAMQTAPPPPAPDIVVTGRRTQDTAAALAACIARHCPPREDIAATLAHAENLFVAGEYKDAQRVASAGIQRNRPHAKRYPVEVSSLQRARARLSENLGETDRERFSTFDMVDTLRGGLGKDDARLFGARLEAADMFAKQKRIRLAEEQYDSVARDARAAGNRTVEGFAMARHALLLTILAGVDVDYAARARRLLRELGDSPVPEHRPFAAVARMGAMRIALRGKDRRMIDAFVADHARTTPTTEATLLFAEPIETTLLAGTPRAMAPGQRADWIDIGFLIDAAGLPQEVETLRTVGDRSPDWDGPVLKSIRSRRYAPLTLPPGVPGLFRIERYTRTWPVSRTTGSGIARATTPAIAMTDLSRDPDPAAPGGTGR